MELSPALVALTAVTAVASAYIHTTSGMGFAMLFTVVTGFYMEPVQSAVTGCFCILALMAIIDARLIRHVNWAITWPPSLGMLVGKLLGVALLMNISGGTFKHALGIFLIAMSLYFFFLQDRIHIKPTPSKGIFLGLLAGIVGGLYNISGPFAAVYFFPACKDKNEYSACMNVSFVPAGAAGCVMHAVYGNIRRETLGPMAVAMLATMAGATLGLRSFERLNRRTVALLLYGYTAVMGVFLTLT